MIVAAPAAYEAEKRRRGVVDFDDLLSMCARALDTDDEFAATQRWRFRHLFVDEFQDVNPVQLRLLKGWLGERTERSYSEMTWAPSSRRVAAISRLNSTTIAVVSEP
mgnify:CR=1 FL=1